ncbi:hypothetical protein [Corynebacterium mayonis]|uniref:hypothetical protein n=1 Tax=Corynebacterium mayonis TaxID=3062461 RepID=UPI0031406E1E
MAYILITLGVVALVAALLLLVSDVREKSEKSQRCEDLGTDSDADNRMQGEEPGALNMASVTGEPEVKPEKEREPEPEAEDVAPEPNAEEPAPELEATLRPHRRSGLQLPGSSRRERRAWAQRHDFSFAKQDEFLLGEWERGAASTGAAARDVASGSMYGHETFVADLGGVTVMAMRTGEISDVVVDLRRNGFLPASSNDLVEVGQFSGFSVHATEANPAKRFLDVRVRTALEQLPATVSAVWFESEWVLAETDRGASPDEWDSMLAPLALLADAARVLPPRTFTVLEVDYPGREMGEQIDVPGEIETLDSAAPKVQRPEEPLEMPTRSTGARRGEMDYRAVGGDEVEAIADGAQGPETDSDGAGDLTRVRREQHPPSIFGD